MRVPGVINCQMSAREPSRDKEVEAADVGHRRWKLTQPRLGAASSGGNESRQVLYHGSSVRCLHTYLSG